MKKKILSFLLIMTTAFATLAFAEGEQETKKIDPLNNELFEIVNEVSETEYSEVEYSIYTEDGRLNIDSPYYNLYPGLRDAEKYPYNDGIKRDYYTFTEEYLYQDTDGTIKEGKQEHKVSGLYDINGNCIYTDPMLEISAMSGSYMYNLGYIVHTLVDWRDGGDMIVYKRFQNIVTGEEYEFYVEECSELLNDGTIFFKHNGKYYKARLKKPAIITVNFNSKKVYFDQIPTIENGRTLVPVRAIFEEIGATIDWDDITQTVTAKKDDITISLTINSNTATKNGEEIALDVPAKIIGGRTLVPVRFVSDCFGVKVDWNPTMQQVILETK